MTTGTETAAAPVDGAAPTEPVAAAATETAPVTTPPAAAAAKTEEPKSALAPDSKTEDGKAIDKAPDAKDAKAPPPVDDKWEPKPVEGMQRDAKAIASARDLFKGMGLNAEQAQKLVDFNDAQSKANDVARLEMLEQTNKGWWKELEADKELGGTNFKQSLANARKAVNALGGKELGRQLVDLGLDNFPPLVRAFEKAGRLISEDTIKGTVKDAGKPSGNSFEQQLKASYPTMFPTKE